MGDATESIWHIIVKTQAPAVESSASAICKNPQSDQAKRDSESAEEQSLTTEIGNLHFYLF